MSSSGIRLEAWDYLRCGHNANQKRRKSSLAAKIVVYAGDEEEYISFLSPEAYSELENWMEFRKGYGERVDGNSW